MTNLIYEESRIFRMKTTIQMKNTGRAKITKKSQKKPAGRPGRPDPEMQRNQKIAKVIKNIERRGFGRQDAMGLYKRFLAKGHIGKERTQRLFKTAKKVKEHMDKGPCGQWIKKLQSQGKGLNDLSQAEHIEIAVRHGAEMAARAAENRGENTLAARQKFFLDATQALFENREKKTVDALDSIVGKLQSEAKSR